MFENLKSDMTNVYLCYEGQFVWIEAADFLPNWEMLAALLVDFSPNWQDLTTLMLTQFNLIGKKRSQGDSFGGYTKKILDQAAF